MALTLSEGGLPTSPEGVKVLAMINRTRLLAFFHQSIEVVSLDLLIIIIKERESLPFSFRKIYPIPIYFGVSFAKDLYLPTSFLFFSQLFFLSFLFFHRERHLQTLYGTMLNVG